MAIIRFYRSVMSLRRKMHSIIPTGYLFGDKFDNKQPLGSGDMWEIDLR